MHLEAPGLLSTLSCCQNPPPRRSSTIRTLQYKWRQSTWLPPAWSSVSPELQAPPKTQLGACHGQPAGMRDGAARCASAMQYVQYLTAPGILRGEREAGWGTRDSFLWLSCCLPNIWENEQELWMINRKPKMHIKRMRAQLYTQVCIKFTTFIQVHEQADDYLLISFAAFNLWNVAFA